ncbi:MAG: MBL fold metallo-hydrolase [Actinobacteria bacterium]|nr:MBL fold metallo-hydrolase [Actinomycetota bacterium]
MGAWSRTQPTEGGGSEGKHYGRGVVKITLIGTGSPIPDPNRAGPSTLVQAAGTNVVVDCGRGCVMRLMAAGVAPPAVDAVLLTHLHSDHISDLNDLVTSRWIMGPVDADPTLIVGPVGTGRVVDGLRAMLALDEQYRLDHHADLRSGAGMVVDVREVSPGDTFEVGDLAVRVGGTDHRPVAPTVGYRIEHAGKTAVLAGDGVPCDGLDDLCRGADAYVQTVLRPDLVAIMQQFVPAQAGRLGDILDYHSSVEDAARTAARCGVSTLVLTHCVPPVQPGQEGEWIGLAAAHFGGRVVVGPDLTSVDL